MAMMVPSDYPDRALRGDLDVAEEPPCSNLELGPLAGFDVHPVIAEERGSTGGDSGASRNTQPDIPDQVEHAEDGPITGRPVPQVQLHIAEEDHDLLVGPSGGNGTLGHVAQEREDRRSRRRPPRPDAIASPRARRLLTPERRVPEAPRESDRARSSRPRTRGEFHLVSQTCQRFDAVPKPCVGSSIRLGHRDWFSTCRPIRATTARTRLFQPATR
jgi:hypothetical protein